MFGRAKCFIDVFEWVGATVDLAGIAS